LIVQLEKSNFAWAYDAFDLFWGSLTVHINAENNFLFPALLNSDRERFGTEDDLPTYEELEKTIEQLKLDHAVFMDQLEELMRELRALQTSGQDWERRQAVEKIKRSVSTFASWFQLHNETEEKKIHSLPARMLPAGDLVRLEMAVRTEIQSLPSRFAWAS
jgi:hemerythrin superfamily protein